MRKNEGKSDKKDKNAVPAFITHALTGGKRSPKNGTTIPTVEGVTAAKDFVDSNKK